MTDKEKAIVMAYTGICLLTGDKFQIFHKYVEDIMGRPIWTQDIGWLEDEIKEKSKADFIALCADESSSENSNNWIPVSERLPKRTGEYFVTVIDDSGEDNYYKAVGVAWFAHKKDYDIKESEWRELRIDETVIAWMPLPEPYNGSDNEYISGKDTE